MKVWFCTLLALAATQTRAEMWPLLQGEALTAALSGQTLAYEDAIQTFYASGRTRYTARQESWGYWRADSQYYCSQWPPTEEWTCYTARISPDGAELRFIDPGGHVSTGTFTK